MKVRPEEVGARLDIYLKENLRDCSRKQAKRLLDAGRVRVNGRKTVIASWELKAGDEVAVAEDPDIDIDVSKYFLKVVYEDEWLLVVEKDAGIPCEASAQTLKPSLVQIINAYLRQRAPADTQPYLGLIHRLDTETSGLMVYTKKKVANKLSRQFKDHRIERRYQAVLNGRLEKESGAVVIDLAKEDLPGGGKVRIVDKGKGKPAKTEYRVLERYADATLVELIPRTGRTHQLRVHMAHLGHPILGDKLYGASSEDVSPGIGRQALHSSILGFEHPITRKKLKFTSELPRDMRRLVDGLRIQS